MSDLERTKEFFDSLGLGYDVEPGDAPDSVALRMTSDLHAKVQGYSYFFAEFVFDTDGDFIHVGIWE